MLLRRFVRTDQNCDYPPPPTPRRMVVVVVVVVPWVVVVLERMVFSKVVAHQVSLAPCLLCLFHNVVKMDLMIFWMNLELGDELTTYQKNLQKSGHALCDLLFLNLPHHHHTTPHHTCVYCILS